MKKLFEIPEITKLSLVTEKVTLELEDGWEAGIESGGLGADIPQD